MKLFSIFIIYFFSKIIKFNKQKPIILLDVDGAINIIGKYEIYNEKNMKYYILLQLLEV
jgi:hypothetical protein